MIKLITQAILSSLKQWKPIMVIYGIQAGIALTVGLQVYQVLDASIGSSLSLDIIAEGFDRTVITDLFNVHGASLSPLIGLVRWIVLIYLVISVFLNGGLLANLVKKEISFKQFLKNGYTYFYSFLKIGLLFLSFLFIWILVTGIPYLMIIGSNPFDTFDTEIPFILWTVLLFCLLLLGLGFLWSWSICTRMRVIRDQKSIFQSIKIGLKDLIKNAGTISLIVLLLAAVYSISMFCYTIIMEDRGAESMFVVLSLVIIQQLFSIFRLGLKTTGYASLAEIRVNQKP